MKLTKEQLEKLLKSVEMEKDQILEMYLINSLINQAAIAAIKRRLNGIQPLKTLGNA